MLFPEIAERRDSPVAEHPEISHFILNPLIHHLSNDPIEQFRRVSFQNAITLAREALRGNHVISLVE